MKGIFGFIVMILMIFSLLATHSNANEIKNEDLEQVTITLLHPTIVKALKGHYGGFTQFQNLRLTKIIQRQVPADLKEDSAFKSPASIYEITLQLVTILGDGKKEKVTVVLSNEFADKGYDVISFDAKGEQ